MTIAKYIDHTLLKADATKEQMEQLCLDAKKYTFATVCVNPSYVSYCVSLLADSEVKVCTVVGFPLGANKTVVKLVEIEEAIKDGAAEIDYVVNISDIKNGEFTRVKEEMQAILKVKETNPDLIVKIIFEVCYLTDEELAKVSEIAKECKIDYVKTSTGFGSGGATEEAVKIMKEKAGNDVKVKASGGVRTFDDAQTYLQLGVSRIGTSNGVSMIEGTVSTEVY